MIDIFFPVYNEGESVRHLVQRVAALAETLPAPLHILIVDDGSSDDALHTLEPAHVPLTVVRHQSNQGLAAALQTGITWLAAQRGPEDIVVLMDGDDTHDPIQVPDMLRELEKGADIVVASRFRRGAVVEGVAAHRRIFSLGAALVAAVLFRIPGVRDYTCGYRAIRVGLLQDLCRRCPDGRLFELPHYGFVCALELLVKLSELQPAVAEIPLRLGYSRKVNASKMRAGRTMMGFFALWQLRRAK